MSLFSHPGVRRFLRYSLVGVSTLSFDLLLLYALTQYLSVPYYIGTPIAFLIAVSINYAVSRAFVFHGTKRKVHHGYFYFLSFALLGAVAITGVVTLLVTYVHLYYLVARILVAGVVGIANYLGNLHLNFKVVGVHHDTDRNSL